VHQVCKVQPGTIGGNEGADGCHVPILSALAGLRTPGPA
jgi:hypothetical protein